MSTASPVAVEELEVAVWRSLWHAIPENEWFAPDTFREIVRRARSIPENYHAEADAEVAGAVAVGIVETRAAGEGQRVEYRRSPEAPTIKAALVGSDAYNEQLRRRATAERRRFDDEARQRARNAAEQPNPARDDLVRVLRQILPGLLDEALRELGLTPSASKHETPKETR